MRGFFTFLGSILLFLLIGVLALPFLFPVENYRDEILKFVQERTGREVKIEGKLNLTLLPNIALEVNDLTIGNPEGFVSPYLAKVGTLQLKVALMPLLNKQVEVNELVVQKAEAFAEETVGGKKNWEFTLQKITKTASGGEAEKPKAESAKNFKMDVRKLTVEDTTLHYLRPGQKISTERFNLDYSPEKMRLDTVLKYAGTNYTVNFATPKSSSLFSNEAVPMTLAVKSPLIKADFSGNANGINLSSGKFDAALDGALSAAVTGIGKVESRQFKGDMKKASLGLMSLDAAMGIHADGDVTVHFAGAKPKVEGGLTIPRLNVDALTGKKSAGLEWNLIPNAYAIEPWSRAPVDFGWLNVADAALGLQIGTLTASGYTLENLSTQLAMAGGKLTLSNLKAALLGGSLTGKATLESSGRWSKEVRLTGIPFDKLMAGYLNKIAVNGTTSLSLSLSSHGRSMADWMQHLSGGGNLSITDGVISGFSMATIFRKTAAAVGGVVESQNGLQTPFSSIFAAFSVDNGIMRLREGGLKGDRLRANAQGDVNMAAQSLNLLLTPELLPPPTAAAVEGQAPTQAASGLMVPVIVSGSFSNITVKPDYSRTIGNIINEALKNPDSLEGLKAQGKAIEDMFEPSKDVIKENWKNLKDTKDPAALNNILNELGSNGVNPLESLGGLGGALGGVIKGAAQQSEAAKAAAAEKAAAEKAAAEKAAQEAQAKQQEAEAAAKAAEAAKAAAPAPEPAPAPTPEPAPAEATPAEAIPANGQ